MKILIVHNFYQHRGGEDAVVEGEVALLREAGHHVITHFVHNDAVRGIVKKIRTACGTIFNFASRKRLRVLIAAERPDIIHVHNFFPQLSPSVFAAARDSAVPSVMTLHNFRIVCPTGSLFLDGKVNERSIGGSTWWTVPLRVYRGSLLGTLVLAAMIEWHKWIGTWGRDVDAYIALTAFSKGKFVAAGLPERRIVVKPNSAPRPVGFPLGSNRGGALFVGRLSEEKGLATLLEAWKHLSSPLTIVGTGPMAAWLAEHRSASTIALGAMARDAVLEEMGRASFLVLPSVCYEMFPVVLAEAFSIGLPVVASRLGGLADLVEDGITGLHFTAGDANDLARVAGWAADHPAEIVKMGENARAKYLGLLTPEANASALAAIYEQVIESHRSA